MVRLKEEVRRKPILACVFRVPACVRVCGLQLTRRSKAEGVFVRGSLSFSKACASSQKFLGACYEPETEKEKEREEENKKIVKKKKQEPSASRLQSLAVVGC